MNLFAIIIGLGATAGLANVAWQNRDLREMNSLVTAGLIVLAGCLLGGRVGFAVLNWSYYKSQPVDIPQIWLGGFSGVGAVTGGLVFLPLAARLVRLPVSSLAGGLYPLLPPLVVSAWLACWIAGVAYGPEMPGSTAGLPARDEWGAFAPRVPLQLAGALISLVLFALLEPRLRLARHSWRSFYLGLLVTVLPAAAVSFVRVDPVPLWAGLRPDSWGFLALSLLTLILFALTYLPTRHPKPSPVLND